MKRLRILLLLFLVTPSPAVCASDSIPLIERIAERYPVERIMRRRYSDNVAMHHLAFGSSQTSFSVGHRWRDENEALSPEAGSGETITGLRAETYLQNTPKDHLWGSASYSFGLKRGVTWHSTSDFSRLYPYVVSSKDGGDLHHEKYAFDGGYGAEWRGWRISGALSYEALHEYRTRDPRPRNITSDFSLGAGLSRSLSAYAVGLSARYDIYKQRSGVSTLGPLGSALQRLMTGLGDSFARFDSNEPTVYYRYYAMDLGVHLLPLSDDGFYGGFGYRYARLEEILSDKNEVPINHYGAHHLSASVAYLHSLGKVRAGGEIASQAEMRLGSEHIIGEPKAGTYPIEGYLPNFGLYALSSRLSLFVSGQAPRHQLWSLTASLFHRGLDVIKAEPDKRLEIDRLSFDLSGRYAFRPSSRMLLSFTTAAAYAPEGASLLRLPYASMEEEQIEKLNATARNLSSSLLTLRFMPECRYVFGSGQKEWSLGLAPYYSFEYYTAAVRRHLLFISVSITF